MVIVIIHNAYGKFSGEEAVVKAQKKLLADNDHKVICFEKYSADISKMKLGKLRAFFSGIYSFSSRRAIRKLLFEQKPDIVHIHNLFPLISPSVLSECRKAGVPVVMTVHNYRLICPNGLFMTNGRVCEKCYGGREYWCVLRNCTGSLPKSIGYAMRNYVARKGKFYLDNVTMYACLTEFQRRRFIARGFPADRITVIPNMADDDSSRPEPMLGDYVSFVGRVSPEKGVTTLIEAAKKLSSIVFSAAGAYDRMPDLIMQAPDNFQFVGHLKSEQLDEFYANSRIIVLPSICYESFGLPLVEAALRSKPVICSRIGALPEIVEDGVTGLLFEPGNADNLAEKIDYLWQRPDLCRQMGQAGREKALREYSPEKYYERLMIVFEKAVKLGPTGSDQNG